MPPLPAVSPFYLVADARERCVIPFLEDALGRHALVVRQVTVGDYTICQKLPGGAPAVRACVERKSLVDFAASIADGRHENVAKLKQLRAATGCQLFYLVEGPAFPSPDRRFHRIPFSTILTATTHLMVRDGIYVVLSENEAHSAQRLADLVQAFDAVAPSPPPLPCAGGEGGHGVSEGGDGARDDGRPEAPAPGPHAAEMAVPELLLARHETTLDEEVTAVWAALRGVSLVFGRILSRQFSVADLACRRVPPERLDALRSATGRAPPKDALCGLRALRGGSPPHELRVVGAARGLSEASAGALLAAAGGLEGLCSLSPEALGAVALPQKGGRAARFGLARARRLLQVLTYRSGEDAASPPGEGGEPARAGPRSAPERTLAAPPARKAAPRRRPPVLVPRRPADDNGSSAAFPPSPLAGGALPAAARSGPSAESAPSTAAGAAGAAFSPELDAWLRAELI